MAKKHNIHILRLLLSNKKKQFTIREISKQTSIDYKTVHVAIQNLSSSNTIEAKKIGQTTLCSLNLKKFTEEIYVAEYSRTQDLLKNKSFNSLMSYFENLEPFFIMLLFGSYASGKQRKSSDIDLMLITDNEKMKIEITQIISLIPLDIHFLHFTTKEYLDMLKTTQFNVGKEAFYNNIIIFGIEDYYRMIKNA